MFAEMDLAGIYVAPIVVYAVLALPIFLVLRFTLARLGLWRRLWHPALFETALYLSILSLLVLI